MRYALHVTRYALQPSNFRSPSVLRPTRYFAAAAREDTCVLKGKETALRRSDGPPRTDYAAFTAALLFPPVISLNLRV